MNHLVFFIHASETTRKLYESALGEGVKLVYVNAGNFSSAYASLGAQLRDRSGRILPNMFKNYLSASDQNVQWDSISLMSYSAGYALVREILKSEDDYKAIDAYVAIDSIHTDIIPATMAGQLLKFGMFATDAKLGKKLFWLGHTDVPTPQTGKGAFASTTQVAAWLANQVGQGGNFVVRGYNTKRDPMDEHRAALNEWGPTFAGEALKGFLAAIPARPKAPEAPKPHRDAAKTLGERCVALSMEQLSNNVRERPAGSNTGPEIKEYLKGCLRGDRLLGLTSGAWCAAAASWVAEQCRLPHETIPHRWRASGLELEQDAMAEHAWVDVEQVRSGAATVAVGDIAMFTRGAISWQRHVTRVTVVPDAKGNFETIGGNEDDKWKLTKRKLSDKELLGFIRYPVPNG